MPRLKSHDLHARPRTHLWPFHPEFLLYLARPKDGRKVVVSSPPRCDVPPWSEAAGGRGAEVKGARSFWFCPSSKNGGVLHFASPARVHSGVRSCPSLVYTTYTDKLGLGTTRTSGVGEST